MDEREQWDLYEGLWRQTEAESRRIFPELFSFPEDRKVVSIAEAARIMRRSTAEIRRLAEMRFLYASPGGWSPEGGTRDPGLNHPQRG